jgi:hypothetical protein
MDQPHTDANVTIEGLPPNSALIEVHVADLKELFNSFDPTPFLKRDLDPDADEFITGWARDLEAGVPLALLVHVDRAASSPDASDITHQAVRDHFGRRAAETRRTLRLLFRNGRIALVIGLAVVAGCMLLADLIETRMQESRFGTIIREGLVIGGWVAMWRPIEIFLYEWWPIRADARLFDRLSRMIVRVQTHQHRSAP